ncbi:glycosyltransferase family protein [Hymenobacter chitinivorans]|uniref:DUF6311 domain-containing protein n=1 Tax=Hymenobacter chitinivorans DSM 11115 TaxID=1121954 RepID=A0A2M9ARZ8_9BACT|nr:hypothetical protein [Hymenobacter chitinivorans]PJJ48477.1 hypothetical protein CLV45_4185 [Hymenobacter chitinivorans DSM 11115]
MNTRFWLLVLGVLLSYLLVFGAWTWPLASQLSSAFPAFADQDGYMQLWNVWHFREAVLSGQNPFFSNWLLYPDGASLWLHTYIPVAGMVNVFIGNEMLALNLTLAAEYALSGLGAWLLARRWVRQPVLAWLAGLYFAFSPYKMVRLPYHFDLVLTATVPFYILAFLRAFWFEPGRFWPQVRSWKAVAACFVLGVITLFSDYYVLFALLYFSLAYALWFWLALGNINWRKPRPWLILAVALIVTHIAIRLIRLAGVPDNSGFWWGGDLVGYFLPADNSRWLNFAWARQLYNDPKVFNMPGSVENVMFLGYAVPLVVVLASFWPGRAASRRHHDLQGRPLAWVLLFFVLLTLPALRVLGHVNFNLPNGLLHFIPFFNNIRCPTRWVLLVTLLLPIVGFSALEAAWDHAARPVARGLLSAALLAVVLFEFWPVPPPLDSSRRLPAAFQAVAKLPGEALFTLPVGLVDGYRQVGKTELRNFLYQPYYRKKIPSAYISRVAAEQFAQFEADTVMHTLVVLQELPAESDTVVVAPSATAAARFRRRYQPSGVLVSPAWRNGPAHRYLRQVFPDFREQSFPDGYVLLAPAGSVR